LQTVDTFTYKISIKDMQAVGPTYCYDDKVKARLGAKTKPAPWLVAVCTEAKTVICTFDKHEQVEACEKHIPSLNKVSAPVQGIGCKRPSKYLGLALDRPIAVNGELGAIIKCKDESDAAMLYGHVLSWISPQYAAFIWYDKIKIKQIR